MPPFLLARYRACPSVVRMQLYPVCFNSETIDALGTVVGRLAKESKSISGLLLTGTKHFCTGADLGDKRLLSKQGGAWMNEQMTKHLDGLANLPFPSFSAINGYAIGGGAELACSTDFRVMHSDARMQFVQIKFGILPGWGGLARLVQIVGSQKAKLMLLESRRMDTGECLRNGLADFVAADPEKAVLDRFFDTSEKSTIPFDTHVQPVDNSAVTALKACIHHNASEADHFKSLWMGDLHKEKLKIFLARKSL